MCPKQHRAVNILIKITNEIRRRKPISYWRIMRYETEAVILIIFTNDI